MITLAYNQLSKPETKKSGDVKRAVRRVMRWKGAHMLFALDAFVQKLHTGDKQRLEEAKEIK